MSASALLADAGTFEEHETALATTIRSRFKDTKRYRERVQGRRAEDHDRRRRSSAALARIGGHPTVLCVFEFGFLGGSMGSVVGEKLTRAIELAIDKHRAGRSSSPPPAAPACRRASSR